MPARYWEYKKMKRNIRPYIPETTTAEEAIAEESSAELSDSSESSDPSALSDPSDESEVSEEPALSDSSEESKLNDVPVSQISCLAQNSDSPHPSPSTCSNCGIESNLGMPRLPNRKANKVQSNLQPFYLGALNRRHR